MSKVTIGKSDSGKNIGLDILKLAQTRLLVTANSGGGKSYFMRYLLEKTFGKAQHIVFDIEGEYRTLTEKFDYVVAGEGGHIPIDLATANVLAQKALEHQFSLILDLSDMQMRDRLTYVAKFATAAINVKRSILKQRNYAPLYFVVDEAHIFCPENNNKSEARTAIIDLCTRGRKRGYCAILATQRISKLSKDAAAECNNKLVGRITLDVDIKRATDELGFHKNNAQFRKLASGEFYCYGPAISEEVQQVKIASVKTNHEKRSAVVTEVARTVKIEKIIEQLTEVPTQFEDEIQAQEVDALRKKVRALTGQLQSFQQEYNKLRVQALEQAQTIETLKKSHLASITNLSEDISGAVKRFANDIAQRVSYAVKAAEAKTPKTTKTSYPREEMLEELQKPVKLDNTLERQFIAATAVRQKEPVETPNLNKCAKSILGFLQANSYREWSKAQVGAMTGYSAKSGGFNNALAALNTLNLIERVGGSLRAASDTTFSSANYRDIDMKFSIDNIKAKLNKCAREIFEVLLNHPEDMFSKETLAAMTPSQYKPGSGGFNNALAKLNTLELIERLSGDIRLSSQINELVVAA